MEKEQSKTADREIRISRLLNAPVDLVWEVWTNPDHIKNWWGPNGFTNTITKMDIKPGGEWDLVMHGPDGTDYKNKSRFREVTPLEKLVYEHVSAPKFTATIDFKSVDGKTQLDWHMLFETKEEFIQVVKTFKADEGLRQNVEKLGHYLETRLQLHKDAKTTTTARTSTYLNFPGNTEEAFLFYRSVFGTEFAGKGLQRFGDLPAGEGHPPMNDELKQLIIHVELPIVGGHMLMGTDAPESMGFKLIFGNNSSISLEPDNREETKRLYDALCAGGKVTMELKDMLLGDDYFAYFGSCTDKFGVNWMFNCGAKEK